MSVRPFLLAVAAALPLTATALTPPAAIADLLDASDVRALAALERLNHGRSLWVESGRLSSNTRQALDLLAAAPGHGLDSDDYFVGELERHYAELAAGDPGAGDRFELLLNAGLIRYIEDMRPVDFESLPAHERNAALARLLLAAAAGDGFAALRARIEPAHPQYAALQHAFAELQQKAFVRGPGIGPGPTLDPGSSGPRVAALRQRLLPEQSGTGTEAGADDVFDPDLEAAVREYQTLHGLEPDGKVGRRTRAHLDMDVDEIRARLRLNLARWRRLPVDLGRDHLHVNIPEYRLALDLDGERRLAMRVVVGSRENQTPEFVDELEYLVFNPYWYVPRSIWSQEILPRALEDPGYLAANGYELIGTDGGLADPAGAWTSMESRPADFSVRQRPGPNNALGAVKFIFPNEFNVYLHDSPARHLYGKSQRAFSHGCVRVEAPAELAAALLSREPGWDEAAVAAAFAAGRRRHARLSAPLPVYLTYLTARVDDDGRLLLFDDIYGRDEAMLAARR